MHEPHFDPKNELEQQLIAAQQGELPANVFFQRLLDFQVFLPVKDEETIQNFQASNRAVPLTLEDEEGNPALVLFTSPDRAKPFLEGREGFGGGILVTFRWVLDKLGTGSGITVNPGWPVGLELDSSTLQQLAGHLGGAGPN